MNGAISSFDAGRIALHVAGPPNPQLTGNQLIVADVSGNNQVTSFDAAMIAKYVAGPPYAAPGIGSTSTWRFTPVNRSYPSVTGSITGEDYSALLMGDVSGNWANTGARPGGGVIEQSDKAGDSLFSANSETKQPDIFVNLPYLIAQTDKEVVVPVNVIGAANKGIIAYEFGVRYDPKVLLPQFAPADLAETLSRALTVVTHASEPGLLRVVVYGAFPIESDGVLLNLRFTSVGAAGFVSQISFEGIMFNEGEATVSVANGQVSFF